MPAIYRNGATAYTLGAGGTAATARLGASGTTTYTLGGSGVVNGHYTLGGVTTAYTLGPGDTAVHNYTLAGGLSSYNLNQHGGGNSYSLNPAGGSTGSNLQMGPQAGTTAYTLGAGSAATATSTLGVGSTHSYTLSGPSSIATITTTIGGITTTATLGNGDSASTSIVTDASAALAESLDANLFPAEETTTYDLGDGGSSETSYGSNAYGIYLVLNFNYAGIYQGAPYLAIIPDGSDAAEKSFPFAAGGMGIQWRGVSIQTNIEVTTPTGPEYISNETSVGNFQVNYNCQRWRIGTIEYDGTKWTVTQTLLGQISLPDEVFFEGISVYNSEAVKPWEDGTWPLFQNENDAWWGPWNDFTKYPGSWTEATVPVYP